LPPPHGEADLNGGNRNWSTLTLLVLYHVLILLLYLSTDCMFLYKYKYEGWLQLRVTSPKLHQMQEFHGRSIHIWVSVWVFDWRWCKQLPRRTLWLTAGSSVPCLACRVAVCLIMKEQTMSLQSSRVFVDFTNHRQQHQAISPEVNRPVYRQTCVAR